jgi:hypothetical protein
MFMTHCHVHIASADEFESRVIDDSLGEWSRGSMSAIFTECGQLGHFTRERNTIDHFTKLSLKTVRIQTRENDFLFFEDAILDKFFESGEELSFVDRDNLSLPERRAIDETEEIVYLVTIELNVVVRLQNFIGRPCIFC